MLEQADAVVLPFVVVAELLGGLHGRQLAAIVLQHNLALHSRDAYFGHLSQLVRV